VTTDVNPNLRCRVCHTYAFARSTSRRAGQPGGVWQSVERGPPARRHRGQPGRPRPAAGRRPQVGGLRRRLCHRHAAGRRRFLRRLRHRLGLGLGLAAGLGRLGLRLARRSTTRGRIASICSTPGRAIPIWHASRQPERVRSDRAERRRRRSMRRPRRFSRNFRSAADAAPAAGPRGNHLHDSVPRAAGRLCTKR
jgi:hypothetical protein